MLKLPAKRWKKARVEPAGPGRYTLVFISPLKDEAELQDLVEDEIEMCLDRGERVVAQHWASRSLTLEVADIAAFKRRLLYVNITPGES